MERLVSISFKGHGPEEGLRNNPQHHGIILQCVPSCGSRGARTNPQTTLRAVLCQSPNKGIWIRQSNNEERHKRKNAIYTEVVSSCNYFKKQIEGLTTQAKSGKMNGKAGNPRLRKSAIALFPSKWDEKRLLKEGS
jgi:hypothetical protein